MNTLTIIAFCIYLSIVAGVALVAFLITRNLSDFVLGGRRLGGPVAALSAGASDMSAWLLLALPGAVFTFGLNQIWLPIGLTVGAYLSWRFIARPLRVFSEIAKDSLTLPSFLDNRFCDKSGYIRLSLAIVTLIFFTFYTASGLVGGAMLLERFNLDYHQGLLLGTSIIVAYTFIGGFLAVSWTDFFQGTMMFCFLLAVPIIGINALGGWEPTMTLIDEAGPQFKQPLTDFSPLLTFNLLAWGLGYLGQPHILVRYMAVKSVKEIPIARRICITWMSLSMLGAVLTGFVGIAYFFAHDIKPESIFILFSQELFSPWLAGILFAAILSSIMCAIDSQMLASSSAITEDIYHKFRPQASQKELMLLGRGSIIVIALIAIMLALNPQSTVIDLVAFAWAGLGGAFGPSVVLALFWSRMTSKGALAGIISGTIAVILWSIFDGGVFEIYEIIPGFFFGILSIIIVSLLDKKPNPEAIAQFNKAWDLIRTR